jgi:hypothetical protein
MTTQYMNKGHKVYAPLAGFAMACLIHGFYDLFLISPGWLSSMGVLSILILILTIAAYGRILNNAINLSPFFDQHRAKDLSALARYLGGGICAVIIMQYLIIALQFGPRRANLDLARVLINSYLIVMVVIDRLGKIKPQPGCYLGMWEGLRKNIFQRRQVV